MTSTSTPGAEARNASHSEASPTSQVSFPNVSPIIPTSNHNSNIISSAKREESTSGALWPEGSFGLTADTVSLIRTNEQLRTELSCMREQLERSNTEQMKLLKSKDSEVQVQLNYPRQPRQQISSSEYRQGTKPDVKPENVCDLFGASQKNFVHYTGSSLTRDAQMPQRIGENVALELSRLRVDCGSLIEENRILQRTVAERDSQLESADSSVLYANARLEALAVAHYERAAELEAATRRAAEASSRASELQVENVANREHIAVLQKKFDALEAAQTKSQCAEDFAAQRCASLERALGEARTQASSTSAELQTAQDSITIYREQIKVLANEASQLRSMAAELQLEKAAKSRLSSAVNELSAYVAALESQCDETQRRAGSLEQQLVEAQARLGQSRKAQEMVERCAKAQEECFLALIKRLEAEADARGTTGFAASLEEQFGMLDVSARRAAARCLAHISELKCCLTTHTALRAVLADSIRRGAAEVARKIFHVPPLSDQLVDALQRIIRRVESLYSFNPEKCCTASSNELRVLSPTRQLSRKLLFQTGAEKLLIEQLRNVSTMLEVDLKQHQQVQDTLKTAIVDWQHNIEQAVDRAVSMGKNT